ncbi:MAG: hypothetical protein IMF07_00540 [Proteobacteria bacterium]|nr:hypothetical protein [Pseudomonadota bacterium]
MLAVKTVDRSKTFATFIEGDSNRLAKSMAMAASENPAGSYNPLYIYGGRGTGKSHLLQAVCNEAKLRGREFFFGGLSTGSNLRLPEGPTSFVVLDDVDINLPEIDESLNEFVNTGGQLVLSGGSSPEDLAESPLSEMISGTGSSADLQMPEEELRVAILQARADAENIALPDDAARFIASHIPGSIQNLIGGLERVKALSSLSGQSITRFGAIQALREYLWKDEGEGFE